MQKALSCSRLRPTILRSFIPVRHFATPTDQPVSRPERDPATPPGPPLRPHLNLPVNPNHGLYGFFRKIKTEKGVEAYETVEVTATESGRSWRAAELRRKSFQDLHTLWYVLLRERNLLATQDEGLRRITGEKMSSNGTRNLMCRQAMARIKCILGERRLAYEGALKIHEAQRQVKAQVKVEARQLNKDNFKRKFTERKARWTREQKRKQAEKLKAIETQKAKEVEKEIEKEENRAGSVAARGIF
ncbi:hypothetical protein JAAARDRAFT_54259 [Jaapia argillacea MUCL 33604]|uniref:Large ribosomal subunit protein uL29m n=1 Tax=Jaapia argillacea MUCL 33604 TaxID=933084 RepID=A0A067Q7Z4_9AGAM|nr:hypothetical protein JAAARDRAFT_54259 [Jaapia argillacea MUCL 33604]